MGTTKTVFWVQLRLKRCISAILAIKTGVFRPFQPLKRAILAIKTAIFSPQNGYFSPQNGYFGTHPWSKTRMCVYACPWVPLLHGYDHTTHGYIHGSHPRVTTGPAPAPRVINGTDVLTRLDYELRNNLHGYPGKPLNSVAKQHI